jgi:hypothetical protein
VGTSSTHVRPISVLLLLLKIHFAQNRNNFSPANTYLVQKQNSWTTTTSSTVRKAPKITQLEHIKTHSTSALLFIYGKSVPKKKHGRSSPVGFHPASSGRWWYVPTSLLSWLLLPVDLNSNSAISLLIIRFVIQTINYIYV